MMTLAGAFGDKMHEITLHENPVSPYCQKNKIALREKGIAFTLVQPVSGQLPPAYLGALNPRGEVPVLTRGDAAIFNSSIIQEYIEDCWPAPPLLPSTPAARARSRMIEDIMDTHYEAVVWGLIEVKSVRRPGDNTNDALSSRAQSQLRGLHNWLMRELGAAPWFNGENFGSADVAVVPFVAGAMAQGAGPPPRSALGLWFSRALHRSSVSATIAEARAALDDASRPVNAGGTPAVRREYRDHRLDWMIRSGGLGVVHRGIAAETIRFSNELC